MLLTLYMTATRKALNFHLNCVAYSFLYTQHGVVLFHVFCIMAGIYILKVQHLVQTVQTQSK